MVKLTAFISGAAVLILELLGVRLLTPTFGTSILVWSAVIGVFLASLSAGYFLGGQIADRYPHLRTLGMVLLLGGTLVAASAGAAYPVAAWMGQARIGGLAAPLLATLILFALPSMVLASVSPIAIKLETSKIEEVGSTSGRIFAISTIGSILGTLSVPFLITYIPVRLSLFLLASILAFFSIPFVIPFTSSMGRHRHGILLL